MITSNLIRLELDNNLDYLDQAVGLPDQFTSLEYAIHHSVINEVELNHYIRAHYKNSNSSHPIYIKELFVSLMLLK